MFRPSGAACVAMSSELARVLRHTDIALSRTIDEEGISRASLTAYEKSFPCDRSRGARYACSPRSPRKLGVLWFCGRSCMALMMTDVCVFPTAHRKVCVVSIVVILLCYCEVVLMFGCFRARRMHCVLMFISNGTYVFLSFPFSADYRSTELQCRTAWYGEIWSCV